jgi:hypothetical protein
MGYSPGYNFNGVVVMSYLKEIIEKMQELSAEELLILYRSLVQKIAVPLHDPSRFYDDWDDSEVDRAYAETW